MPAYHQMGHHSQNLLAETDLSSYGGALVSPVNYVVDEVTQLVEAHQTDSFDFVLDPQLYFPTSERGHLLEWSYFPSDFDTADLSSAAWWSSLVEGLVGVADSLGCAAVASPAVVPRRYDNDYFAHSVSVAVGLVDQAPALRTLQTVLVSFDELSQPSRPLAIASVVSQTKCDGIYLVLVGETEPRREISDEEGLKGAMVLIAALEEASLPVLVGYSSTDVVLWKVAGATSCATEKFFNLRRFTRSRFEEPNGGGGQLPYWVEESLLSFLRESDLLRVQQAGLLAGASHRNPYSSQIFEKVRSGEPWLALAWRQYMWWFCDIESRLSSASLDVRSLLRQAESNWNSLDDNDILMEERRNDGTWLRSWRRALAEYRR